MTAPEQIRDIFSILHDGVILAWTGHKALLTLTVECKYLANRIDKSFNNFHIELSHIDSIEFDPWTNPIDSPAVIKTNPIDIFKAELEILSADIKGGKVFITCNQDNTDFDYCGGSLTIDCKAIEIFDQNGNPLTIDELGKICNDYWEEWRRK